ncbi:MAG: hypothetical protein N2654_01365 [Deltaproteobacteria bacterium]|nr:hypothetical protein [Deltaproteobacteria bacterium]
MELSRAIVTRNPEVRLLDSVASLVELSQILNFIRRRTIYFNNLSATVGEEEFDALDEHTERGRWEHFYLLPPSCRLSPEKHGHLLSRNWTGARGLFCTDSVRWQISDYVEFLKRNYLVPPNFVIYSPKSLGLNNDRDLFALLSATDSDFIRRTGLTLDRLSFYYTPLPLSLARELTALNDKIAFRQWLGEHLPRHCPTTYFGRHFPELMEAVKEIFSDFDAVVIQLQNSAGGIGTIILVKQDKNNYAVIKGDRKFTVAGLDEAIHEVLRDKPSETLLIISPFYGTIEKDLDLNVESGSVGYLFIPGKAPKVLRTHARKQIINPKDLSYIGFDYQADETQELTETLDLLGLRLLEFARPSLAKYDREEVAKIIPASIDFFIKPHMSYQSDPASLVTPCEANVRDSAVQSAIYLILLTLGKTNQLHNPIYNPFLKGSEYSFCQCDQVKIDMDPRRNGRIDYEMICEHLRERIAEAYSVPAKDVRLFNRRNFATAAQNGEMPILFLPMTAYNPHGSIAVLLFYPKLLGAEKFFAAFC